MKKVLRCLYRNPRADLDQFPQSQVETALAFLVERLGEEMLKQYRWLATCTAAVTAGLWGGERRRKRRLKLFEMANTCRRALGQPEVVMLGKDGKPSQQWATVGLYYGYSAQESYGRDKGLNHNQVFVLSHLDSHGPEHAVQVAALLRAWESK